MAKKINAKDQTEELNRARLEFLKRNPEKLQKLVDLLQQNEKKRGEFLDCLSAISTMCDGENRDIWDFLLRETFFDKELKNKIKEIEIPPAVHSVWRWLDYNIETQYQRMANRENYNRGILVNLTNEEMKEKIIDMHCRDAREIFTELMNDRPAVHLLMGVDLSRSKGVILGEVEKLVTDYKTRLGIREAPEQRFKWLSIVDELLEIWDTWAGYGQRRCFSLIAKEKEIPESTV
ncbi:MAG TPA: hypothetical protein PLV15_10560, partial [Smithella sp.]|nr:hypothetical protein [Smithella sp.]